MIVMMLIDGEGEVVKPPNRTPRPVREIIAACWKPNPAERPTFQQLSGRIAYIQNIRFAVPPAEKFTLNKPKVVSRIDMVEDDSPDCVYIELDYVSNKCVEKEYETKSRILQRRVMQNQLEEKKAKELEVRSLREFYPTTTTMAVTTSTTDGKASKARKRFSVEDLNDKDDGAQDDKEPGGGATKETVEEMEPTDR